MSVYLKSLDLHLRSRGKIAVGLKVPLRNMGDLALAYTPGVAAACREIAQDETKVDLYTNRANTVAIVSDGSAVLGLGDIGPRAALPVMEGKAVIFKAFAGIDAYPLCISADSDAAFVQAVCSLEPSFSAVNLEDISAPRCFGIEEQLREKMGIPVFHDDQHGTAIAVLGALINSFKLTMRRADAARVVVNGCGAAGVAVTKLLLQYGFKDIIVCDSFGAIYRGRKENMNPYKLWIADHTNGDGLRGTLCDVIGGADVFIGLSAPGVLTPSDVRKMAKDPIVFAMANPEPEIDPAEAKRAGARVVGTGRSDYPNQVNNALVFPGFFLGLLASKARSINSDMMICAADALASVLDVAELSEERIVPDVFDERVVRSISLSVALSAMKSGLSGEKLDVHGLRARIEQNLTSLGAFGKSVPPA